MQQKTNFPFPLIPLWLVWLLAVFFATYGLGSYAILDNNEGLYAEIPREMLRSGDWRHWIIPHLNGLAYMEKPPLLYWLTAISFSLFGESEWSARLVPALASLSCVAMLLRFSTRLRRMQAGRLAAAMFVSGLGVTAMSRTLMFDMLLTALLTAAFMSGYVFCTTRQKTALYWSFSMLALALLAKGFVALVLFCAVLGGYLLTQATSPKDFICRLTMWLDWRGISLFLFIAAPWHIVATLTEPLFAWFYFINEHVLRFLGKREPHDYYAGAWWYYLPRMLVYLFPWSFFLPVLLFTRSRRPINASLQWFMACAWILPVLFFSVSSAKANYYLVAVMPLATLQLAMALEDRGLSERVGLALPGLLLAALFGIVALMLGRSEQGWLASLQIGAQAASSFVRTYLLALTGLSVVTAMLAWKSVRVGIFAYLLIPLATLPMFLNILQASDEWTSARPLAQLLQASFSGREVVLYEIFENKSSLPFYLKAPVKVVGSRSSDLFWGNKLHENQIVLSDSAFETALQHQRVGLVVMNQDVSDFETKNYYKNFKQNRKIGNITLFLN
ncbi:MAG: glycosyltransferase family 39 protein [Burkholderiales bacterium]|nr:glycosyltransferase family 39 protein [Burkholderiales bacterium]